MQRVIVNGADNFIGERVLAALQQSGWAEPQGIAGGDTAALIRALPDSAAVAHCAVGDAGSIRRAADALYAGLRTLAAVPRVVHLSSMTVYGTASGRIDERTEPRADGAGYALAQIAAERQAADYPNHVILRPGVEYGPRCPAWSARVARWLYAGRLGDLGAAGDGICNLIFIDDLAAAIVAALRTPDISGQVFNLAGGEKPTWNEYFSNFAIALAAVPVRRITGRRLRLETKLLAPALKILELGAAPLRLGAWVPPAIPPSLLQTCGQMLSLDGSKAERLFGLQWLPLHEGLRRTAAHYRRATVSSTLPPG